MFNYAGRRFVMAFFGLVLFAVPSYLVAKCNHPAETCCEYVARKMVMDKNKVSLSCNENKSILPHEELKEHKFLCLRRQTKSKNNWALAEQWCEKIGGMKAPCEELCNHKLLTPTPYLVLSPENKILCEGLAASK